MDLPFPLQTQSRLSYSSADLVRKVLFFFFVDYVFQCNIFIQFHVKNIAFICFLLCGSASLLSYFLDVNSKSYPFEAALSPNRMDLPFSLQTQSRSSYSFADLVRKVLFFIQFHVKNIAFIWFLVCGSASLLSYFLYFSSKSYPFEAALSPNRMDLHFSLQTQSRSSCSSADLVRKVLFFC